MPPSNCNCPRLFAIRNARPFSSIFFKTLKTSPSLTSKRHSWQPFTTHLKLTIHSPSEAISAEFLRLRRTSALHPRLKYLELPRSGYGFPMPILHKSQVRKRSFGFNWFFFSFRWVRFRSIVELNRTQSMNWVRFGSLEIWFDLLISIYYAEPF